MHRFTLFSAITAITVITAIMMAPTAAAEPGEVLWKFDVSNISGPFVSAGADGTIYTADADRLWAINPDGTVKWTFEDAGGNGGLPVAGGGQPVDFLPDGRLVVGAAHTIWVLDTDGTVQWSFSWDGGYNNQIDNGPGVGPDGHIYATTATNDGLGMGVFSLDADGQLRWQDETQVPLYIFNASHGQRVWFTDSRMIFGFTATSGPPSIYAFDFEGDLTNDIDYTCTSSPKADPNHLLLAGVCGVQAIDLESDSIVWNVDLGAVNMLPVVGGDGVVYSASWHGPATAISPQGQVLWTSPGAVSVQRTLGVNDEHQVFLYAGETFGNPNWFGAIDTASGASLWQVPFEPVDGHNELSWSNEAAFSPDGSVAYFTTRFTSNGAPGRLYAVRIADVEVPPMPGDATGDGVVNVMDLIEVTLSWGACPAPPDACDADFDDDHDVDVVDLVTVLLAWSE